MEWKIIFTKSAYKEYKSLPFNYYDLVKWVLIKLASNEKIEIKTVKGEKDIFRIRVGKYRILVKKMKDENIFLIIKIGKRGDVYK